MDPSSPFILIGSGVVFISILASAMTARLGAPLLLVFLVMGMLFGTDGPGGIQFEDIRLAHLLGTLALAVILFDGGLSTDGKDFRVGLYPALVLATLGVLITAAVLAGFIALWLGWGWQEGLLLGAIVSSTDAAAVFSLLRAHGLELKQRVGATLEIESGSNDPMAIFLTVVLITLIQGDPQQAEAWRLVSEFVIQMGLGGIFGLAGGFSLVWLVNHLRMPAGLYPLAVLAGAFCLFGLTAALGGSGFLAIYLTGLVIGNQPLKARLEIARFHDGLARLAQIGMFLMLGLLVKPSELLAVAQTALVVALVLILVARPFAVGLCLLPFRFPWREQAFIGWVGLRGAVPIILTLFPQLVGLPQAQMIFNIVFFVVLVSLLIQGWTVITLARRLGLDIPPSSTHLHRIELDLPGQPDLELIGYRLNEGAPILTRGAERPELPCRVRLVAGLRQGRLLDRCEPTDWQVADELYLLAETQALPELDRLFVPPAVDERGFFGEFVLKGEVRLGELATCYGLELASAESMLTLDELIRREIHTHPVIGDRLQLGQLGLVVRAVVGDRITRVGLKLP